MQNEVNGIIVKFKTGTAEAKAVKDVEQLACAGCAVAIWTVEKRSDTNPCLVCFCDRMKRVTWDGASDERFVVYCSAMASGAEDADDAAAGVDVVAGPVPVESVAGRGLPEFR
ncbi:MAG: hypothetical protein Q8J72_07705 [Rhodocyclaceae bacterium]|nr:hypothetical protein [Rhodocyclaceae bacterium]